MLILIAGLPGSGKSYFGRKLAETVEALYINSDEVRMKVQARGKYSDDDKLGIYKLMANDASSALVKRRDVIVDATFYRQSLRDLFEKLAAHYGTTFRIIFVKADESTTKKRLSEKREFSEADFSVYEKIRDEFEEISMPHLVLTSTDSNLEEMLLAATKYIGHVGS